MRRTIKMRRLLSTIVVICGVVGLICSVYLTFASIVTRNSDVLVKGVFMIILCCVVIVISYKNADI